MLENWSLRRGGRLREVVATGGSTVFVFLTTFLTLQMLSENVDLRKKKLIPSDYSE